MSHAPFVKEGIRGAITLCMGKCANKDFENLALQAGSREHVDASIIEEKQGVRSV
jgi:hypothetical protein